MKRILALLVLCLPVVPLTAQNQADTLSVWNYSLEPHAQTPKDRSIGQIIFWRTKPVADSLYVSRHQELWTPMMAFSIFNQSDSAYSVAESRKVKMSSSCTGPDVGGDMLRVGNLILLNRDICLSCTSYTTKKDFCRPAITSILRKIDKNKVKKLADLEKQMTIKKGVPK